VQRPRAARRSPAHDARRRQLIETAQQLIVERSFEGLRIRDVADRVGINNATLVYYFPGKQALVQGMVEQMVRQFEQEAAAANLGTVPARQALHQYFTFRLAQISQTPDRFIVLHELFARARRGATRDPRGHRGGLAAASGRLAGGGDRRGRVPP